MKLTLVPEAEMARRHAAARRRVPDERPAPPVKVQNARAVLDLGNLTFFTFQGRAYGVPPLPYKAGLALSRLSVEVQKFRGTLTEETLPQYFAVVAQIPPLLWRLSRPVGRFRRLLKRLGLLRNPYLRGTEAELGELLGFFNRVRMKSSIQPLTADPLPRAHDLLDDCASFCAEFPAWCGPDGLPRSWRHYQYGLAYLGRALMRDQLRHAEAARIAACGPDKNGIDPYTEWHATLSRMSGPGD